LEITCSSTTFISEVFANTQWTKSHKGEKNAIYVGLQLNCRIQLRVPYFGALYLSTQADLDLDLLIEVVVQVVYYKPCSNPTA
jgi:hypothetical protein